MSCPSSWTLTVFLSFWPYAAGDYQFDAACLNRTTQKRFDERNNEDKIFTMADFTKVFVALFAENRRLEFLSSENHPFKNA